MNTTKRTSRSVVFTRFFLTYLVILIIPFLVFSALFFPIMGEMKKNSVRESNYVLNSVKDEIDYKLELVYSSTLSLNYNTAVSSLLSSPEKRRDIAQLLMARDGIGQLEPEADTIYIYFPEDEMLLSSKGVYSKLDSLYGEIFSYGAMNYKEFQNKILNSTSQQQFFPDTRVRTDSRDFSAILYLVRIPFGFQSGSNAKILFFIDSSQIDRQIEEYVQKSKSWFAIYTKDLNLIYHTPDCPGDLASFVDHYSTENWPKGGAPASYDTHGIIYTTVTSDFNGWLFVSGVAEHNLFAQVRKNQLTVMVIFLIYAVAGCYAAYYASKRNIQPLHRLLALWGSERAEDGRFIDEYQMLESNFQDIISHNQELTEFNWMQNLICGRYNTMEEIEELELPQIAGFTHFQVMIIDFSSSAFVLENQSLDHFNRQRYIIKNGLKQLALEQAVIIELSIEQLGILFCSKDSDTALKLQLEKQRDIILDYLKEAVTDRTCLGYGDSVHGPLLIGYSFIQAKCAVRACLEYQRDYMDYASIPRKNEKYYFPDQLREMMFDAIQKGNLKQIKSILKVLQVENFQIRQLSAHQEEQFLEELRSVMLRLKNEDVLTNETLEPDTPLWGQDRFYYYVQLLCSVCMQRTEQVFSQKKKIQQELISFVDEHYQDSRLCLAMAASHFQLSESYFSYLFKKNYGVNFSGYLENKRIEQAKLLILKGQYSLDEIGQIIGYNSSHVFRRAFRKVTGLNPSDLLKSQK